MCVLNYLTHLIIASSMVKSSYSRRCVYMFYHPPAHAVCPNNELVVFQLRTVTAPDLGSVADITTILALPPHLFQPYYGYLFTPPPGLISYCYPIFQPFVPFLSLFTPASTYPHLFWLWRYRPPGRSPHPLDSTARLQFLPIPVGSRSYS